MSNTNMNSRKWFVIINPNAGNKAGFRDWEKISSELNSQNINYEFAFTKEKMHAVEISKTAVENGFRNVIVVGGDGTLNEVVNGFYLQNSVPVYELTIAMIPVGTGNDWCRTLEIPIEYNEAIRLIKNEKIFVQDIGIVKFQKAGNTITRYFVNVAGTGFDADVAKKVNQDKENNKTGKILYIKNLLGTLFSSKSKKYSIRIDGEQINCKVFSMCAGICKFNGAGMMQLPNAVPNDGLLDMTIIKTISKIDVIRNVKNLYNGSFVSHRSVETHQGKHFLIETSEKVDLEIDGESVGHSPFEFSILPNSLNVISEL